MHCHDKLNVLRQDLREMGQIFIAFSGGVDSSFLLKIAQDVLGENVVAVTIQSSIFPERELDTAVSFCREQSVKHLIIESEELDDREFCSNPLNRCYLCKKQLFAKIRQIAEDAGVKNIADGSNFDDLGDYRPGRQALAELGIKSPLLKAQLTKEEIRILSNELGLPTWNKPSYACLSSRIPYGEEITRGKLKMIDSAEQYLQDLGFKQVRVRHHGNVARIEVGREDRTKILELAEAVYEEFSKLGFTYTALDLIGYRTGSMNEEVTGLKKT